MSDEPSTAPWIIRLATPDDIEVIQDLDRMSDSPTCDIHRDIEKYFGSVDPSTHERTFIFLIQAGESIAGKAELMVPPPLEELEAQHDELSTNAVRLGYVRRVIVHPAYRKLGLARKLMQHIIHYAQSELHLSAIDLHVWEGNLPAIRLYEALGFELQHRELYFRLVL